MREEEKNKREKNNPPLILGEIIKSDFLRVYLFWYFFLDIWNKVPIFVKKNKIMAVLNFTSREFRSQQAHVFDLADQGEKIVIRRNKKQA